MDLSRAKCQLPVVSRTPGVKLLSGRRDVQCFHHSILRAFSQDGSILPVLSQGDLADFAENGGRKRVVGGRRLDAKGACTIHIGWYHWEQTSQHISFSVLWVGARELNIAVRALHRACCRYAFVSHISSVLARRYEDNGCAVPRPAFHLCHMKSMQKTGIIGRRNRRKRFRSNACRRADLVRRDFDSTQVFFKQYTVHIVR